MASEQRKPGFESKRLGRAWVANAKAQGLDTLARCTCGQIQAAKGPIPECMFPGGEGAHSLVWTMTLAEYEAEVEALPEDQARPGKRDRLGLDAAMAAAVADEPICAEPEPILKAGRATSAPPARYAMAAILSRITTETSARDILRLAKAARIVSRLP